MDKIIVTANPVRFSTITVYKDGKIKEVTTASLKDIPTTVLNLIYNYKINTVAIAGAFAFTEKIGNDIQFTNKTLYHNNKIISIEYTKGV